jgi:hypothetical protein
MRRFGEAILKIGRHALVVIIRVCRRLHSVVHSVTAHSIVVSHKYDGRGSGEASTPISSGATGLATSVLRDLYCTGPATHRKYARK